MPWGGEGCGELRGHRDIRGWRWARKAGLADAGGGLGCCFFIPYASAQRYQHVMALCQGLGLRR